MLILTGVLFVCFHRFLYAGDSSKACIFSDAGFTFSGNIDIPTFLIKWDRYATSTFVSEMGMLSHWLDWPWCTYSMCDILCYLFYCRRQYYTWSDLEFSPYTCKVSDATRHGLECVVIVDTCTCSLVEGMYEVVFLVFINTWPTVLWSDLSLSLSLSLSPICMYISVHMCNMYIYIYMYTQGNSST